MRWRGRWARATLGIVISLVALLLVVRSVDVAAAWQVLRAAKPEWIVVMLGFVCADLAIRALRWQVLLAPVAAVPYRTTLASLQVGYLANNVLPARLGEVVRAHDLGTRAHVSRSAALGTIVVERVIDTAVVVAIASIAILVLSVRGIVASAVLVGLAVTALLVLLLAIGIAAHRLPGAERAAAYIARWPQAHGALVRLRAGLAVASRPRTVVIAVALSVAAWSCTVLAFAAAAQAVGVEPTMGQAALLAAGTNLATAIPAGPGYVGTFELAVVMIGASVGIDRESALAFGVLIHVAVLAVTSIAGAAVLVAGSRRHGTAGTVERADSADAGDARQPDTQPSQRAASTPGPAPTPSPASGPRPAHIGVPEGDGT